MEHLIFTVEYGDDGVTDDSVLDVFYRALDAAGAHIRRTAEFRFYPQGATVTVILAESHATISTWPEKRKALVDYFSCADYPGFDEFEDVFLRAGYAIIQKEVLHRS